MEKEILKCIKELQTQMITLLFANKICYNVLAYMTKYTQHNLKDSYVIYLK